MKDQNIKLQRFIEKAITKFGSKFDYTKVNYIDNRTNITIVCPIHGDFNITPSNFINNSKYGCQKCGTNEIGKTRRSNTESFIIKAAELHDYKYDYSKVDYIIGHEKVCIICPIHGEFNQEAFSHLSGVGCPKCGYEKSSISQTMSQKEFIFKCVDIHKDRYNYDLVDYKGMNTPIKIICPTHGVFEQLPTVHLHQKCGCNKCLLKNQNLLYDKLKEYFPLEEIIWEYSPEWLDKQRFDISLPKYNIAIEYNGRQHYIPVEKFGGLLGFNKTIERDLLKKEKCIQNNWDLIDMKYDYTLSDYNDLITSIKYKIKSYA